MKKMKFTLIVKFCLLFANVAFSQQQDIQQIWNKCMNQAEIQETHTYFQNGNKKVDILYNAFFDSKIFVDWQDLEINYINEKSMSKSKFYIKFLKVDILNNTAEIEFLTIDNTSPNNSWHHKYIMQNEANYWRIMNNETNLIIAE